MTKKVNPTVLSFPTLQQMDVLDWLFGTNSNNSDSRKRIFISFAIEDAIYRDHLVQQARNNRSPFDFIDMSVKLKWNQAEWKVKCRSKIKRCDAMIVLLSKNTYKAGGA